MKPSILNEINKKYIDAVSVYENSISSHTATLDEYVNLAFLYWAFASLLFEFNIPNNIPDEWSMIGGNRYKEILKLGMGQYPESLELHFWDKYFSMRLWGQEFSEEECRNLISEYTDDASLVPYFYLYLFDKNKYRNEREILLMQCHETPTAKNEYIESFLK